jgi:hypothetical protein
MSTGLKGAGASLPLFLLVLIFLASCSSTQLNHQQAKLLNDPWKYITLTESGKYEIYVNQTSIKRLSENEVIAEVKFYPSQVEREKIKREFEALEREVQQEFGTKVNGTEKLLDEMYSLNSRYFQYRALCKERKVEALGVGPNFIRFFIDVQPNTPAEAILNYLCSFVSEKK